MVHRNEARVIDRHVEFKDKTTGEVRHHYIVSAAKSPEPESFYRVQVREGATARVLGLPVVAATFNNPDKAFETTFAALEEQHPGLEIERLPGDPPHP
jgi:hypothetical protein